MLVPVVMTLAASLRIAFGPLVSGSSRTYGESDGRRKSDTTFAEFRREIFPIGVGVVISAVYFRIDVFLVQWWSGSEAVGLYNAVFRLIDALRLFPAAVMAVVLPSLVRATDTRPLQRTSVAVLAFAIPLTA